MSENSFAEVTEGTENNQSITEQVSQNENVETSSGLEGWDMLEEAFKNKSIVKGKINGSTKGGYMATVEGVEAFLPGSQVDTARVDDISKFQNQELDFLIIKLDVKRKNLVVSRRATMEEQSSTDGASTTQNLEEGQIVDGTVKNITDFGAFIDIGGVDGLLHVSDMSWQSVGSPSDVVSRGDSIKVKVLKIDRERNRIALGLKQLDPNGRPEGGDRYDRGNRNDRGNRGDRGNRKPFERVNWADMPAKFPVGTEYEGTITGVKEFGYFVKIDNGVEGLVHVSAMGDAGRGFNPGTAKGVGEKVSVKVLSIDAERRRMSLGLSGVASSSPSPSSWASAPSSDYYSDDNRGNNRGRRDRSDRGSFSDSRFGNKDNYRGGRSKRRNDDNDRW